MVRVRSRGTVVPGIYEAHRSFDWGRALPDMALVATVQYHGSRHYPGICVLLTVHITHLPPSA